MIIYTLSDPITFQVKYVGKTNDIQKRFNQHIYSPKRGVSITHIKSWIKSLLLKNLKPIIDIVDIVPDESWEFWEQYWISQFKAWGFNLCNHTSGGIGTPGFKMRDESKKKRQITFLQSELWDQKNKDQSSIMKKLHQSGNVKFGYGHLPEEQRKLIGNAHSQTMKSVYRRSPQIQRAMRKARIIPVDLIDINGNILRTFDSVTIAGNTCKIDPTHVSRVCKGKSIATHGFRFQYSKEIKSEKVEIAI